MILIDSTFVNSLGGINILYEILNSIPVKSKKNLFCLLIIDKKKVLARLILMNVISQED